MGKSSLQNLKKRNRTLLLQLLAGNPGISRMALAEKSQLSPATVSSLVAGMLEEGLLTETGEEESTGGRKRICLSLCADYAFIPVLEISRGRAVLDLFDLSLRPISSRTLLTGHIDGNTLFCRASGAVEESLSSRDLPDHVIGVGVVYLDDLTGRDFSVMCTTSLSSETIPLETALASQLRVPVCGESFGRPVPQPEKLAELFPEETRRTNYAFVHLGTGMWAAVFAGGKPVSVMGRDTFSLSPFLEAPGVRQKKELAERAGGDPASLASGAARAFFALRAFFPVQAFMLDGVLFRSERFMSQLGESWSALFPEGAAPKLCPVMQNVYRESRDVMAERVRRRVLLSC